MTESRVTDRLLREDAELIVHHWADHLTTRLGLTSRAYHDDSPEHDHRMHSQAGPGATGHAHMDHGSSSSHDHVSAGAAGIAGDEHGHHGHDESSHGHTEGASDAPGRLEISDVEMRAFHRNMHLTSIDGWALYSPSGEVVASGGTLGDDPSLAPNAVAALDTALGTTLKEPAAKTIITDVKGRSTVLISLVEEGGAAGAIRTDLNQVHTRALIEKSLGQLSAITAIIILITGAVGVAAMWVRLRERTCAQAELRQREAELAEQNVRLDIALDNMSQGLCQFDADKRLVICNRRYLDMYDISPELAKPGTPFTEILKNRIESGLFAVGSPENYVEERLAAVVESEPSTKLQELTDGRIIAIAHRPLPSGGWVATHEDITELQLMQAKVAHMAHHDALTNLPNRVLLSERIDEAMSHTPDGERFAVLCLDIDRFKNVNDTLGHPVGDQLLKVIAARLREIVHPDDTIARLGGDEFAIVHVSGERLSDTTDLASRICEVIRRPFDLDGHQVSVETSIGIAIAPDDGSRPDQLIRCADMALYGAKSDGRGVYRFFEAEMDARMKKRRTLEIGLRKGLERGEFELQYQPIFSSQTQSVTAFEALLRWRHPERGVIAPAEFISVAEETGLIVPLGEWALRQACSEAVGWPDDLKVAVNLSPVQFKGGGLVTTVVNALAASGLRPDRLELEITESVLLLDNEKTLEILHGLRKLGVKIAMDDFGTGYSSLSYLRSFPFDRIKIDRSFIADLAKTGEAAAIVRAVAGLGSSLGMATTAEGVETEEQRELVLAEGYTDIQGFLYSAPCHAEDLAALLAPDDTKRRAIA